MQERKKKEKEKNNRISLCIRLSVILMLLFLSGCSGKEELNETRIRILKKGQIENTIVEAFGMNYYDEAELRKMLEDSIRAYDGKAKEAGRISIKSIETENDMIFVSVLYKSWEDYASFNQVDFFYGSISDALSRGYDMTMTLSSAEDGRRVGLSELSEEGGRILIVSEPVLIEPDSDIQYVSANVEYIDRRQARISGESAGLAYIVVEK